MLPIAAPAPRHISSYYYAAAYAIQRSDATLIVSMLRYARYA